MKGYIEDLHKSNIIVEYEIKDDIIKIKTGDNKEITIKNEDSYIDLLNGILSAQQKYQNIERKKELISKEKFNKKERTLMFIFLLASIALIMYFPNVLTSVILLLSIILSAVSEVSHVHNVLELRKLNDCIANKKTLVVADDYVPKTSKEEIEVLDEKIEVIEDKDVQKNNTLLLLPAPIMAVQDDEVLLLDEEM